MQLLRFVQQILRRRFNASKKLLCALISRKCLVSVKLTLIWSVLYHLKRLHIWIFAPKVFWWFSFNSSKENLKWNQFWNILSISPLEIVATYNCYSYCIVHHFYHATFHILRDDTCRKGTCLPIFSFPERRKCDKKSSKE